MSLLARAMREFGVTVEGPGTQADAQSGAGVWAVPGAFLKITPAGPAAERELHFYRAVAPIAPVRTPALLGVLADESGVALLLADAGSPRPAVSWTPSMWAELGTALALLHGLPVPPGAPAAFPPVDEAFWGISLPDPAALVAALAAVPLVLTHGDCHAANLLHGPAGLVFCDWQSAGPGRPTTDLAFPSVRATPSGVVVPPTLLDAYLSTRPLDRDVLRRALIAEELATFLCHWPAYAPVNSPAGNARVVDRVRGLTRRWLAFR